MWLCARILCVSDECPLGRDGARTLDAKHPASTGSPGWRSLHSRAHICQPAPLEFRSSNFCSMRLHSPRVETQVGEQSPVAHAANQEARRARRLLSMVSASQVLANAVHMGGMGACRFEWQAGGNSKKNRTAAHHCQ